MQSRFDWVKRRRQAARCEIHGLHYDPELTAGCILCRKEGMLAPIRQGGPQLILLLLAVLGMVLIAFYIFGPGFDLGEPATIATTPESLEPVAPPLPKLDPESFRQPLAQIEGAAFRPLATELEQIGAELATALLYLSRSIRSQEADHDVVADELVALSETIDPSAFTLGDLEAMRQRWISWRFDRFAPAPWFESSTGLALETDRAEIAVYRNITHDLIELIEESAVAAAPSEEEPDADPQPQESLQASVEDLRQRLPKKPPTHTDARILVAIQRLDQALTRIAAVDTAGSEELAQAQQTASLALTTFDDLLAQ